MMGLYIFLAYIDISEIIQILKIARIQFVVWFTIYLFHISMHEWHETWVFFALRLKLLLRNKCFTLIMFYGYLFLGWYDFNLGPGLKLSRGNISEWGLFSRKTYFEDKSWQFKMIKRQPLLNLPYSTWNKNCSHSNAVQIFLAFRDA